MFMMFHTKCRS